MIQTASCAINDLFAGAFESEQEDGSVVQISGRLNIPEYQRPYLWGKKETDKLLYDLAKHFLDKSENAPDYYLGSIILHQKGDSLNIIDGQQRLTTLALLLTAINGSAHIPTIDYSSPSTTQHIRDNFRYISSKDLSHFNSTISEKINVTLVVTDREDDAYTFFETQNTGGVRLSGVDIIKAYHLRAINKKKLRNDSALSWEKQSCLPHVCTLLLKARYWRSFKGVSAPSRNNQNSLKNAVVDEFSDKTRKEGLGNVGYVVTQISQTAEGWWSRSPDFRYAIRQPLIDGENLIDYMVSFSSLYQQVLPYSGGDWKPKEYNDFVNRVIKPVDGTLFLKELFEISILCYSHRFGTEKLYEAALWLFRCTYSLRLKNEKTVKETSVPQFLKDYPVIDIILNAFDHRELITELKEFPVQVHSDNLTGNTVKARYLKRLSEFFNANLQIKADLIDSCLKEAITSLLKQA